MNEERQLWFQTLDADEREGSKNPLKRLVVSKQRRGLTASREPLGEQPNEDPIESLRKAVKTVQETRNEWKGQKRLRDGKVQSGFHKLLGTLDGYSNVLSMLPNNEYTALFCGAIKVLVKVRSLLLLHSPARAYTSIGLCKPC